MRNGARRTIHIFLFIIPGIVVLGFLFRQYRNTKGGRKTTDTIALKLPIFGELLKKTAVARFTRTLGTMLSKLHTKTAIILNEWDNSPGRKVWFQYWDSLITFPASYYARLQYVHQNPVHHGIVSNAENYPWCSAAWFTRTARVAFVNTVKSFKTDRVQVRDEFEPMNIDDAL